MNQQLASFHVPPLPAKSLEVPTPLLPTLRAALPEPGLSPGLRGRSIAPIAVRNEFRSSPLFPALALLQKCAGIGLVGGAWLLFLFGLANLVLAALHNQQGELGLGVASTLFGAKSCLASFVVCAAGMPQWVMGERKLKATQGRPGSLN